MFADDIKLSGVEMMEAKELFTRVSCKVQFMQSDARKLSEENFQFKLKSGGL